MLYPRFLFLFLFLFSISGFNAQSCRILNLNNVLSSAQWDTMFPKRVGLVPSHPQGYTSDFYSYSNLKSAVEEMQDFKVIIKIKDGLWGEHILVVRKSIKDTFNYAAMPSWWHSSTNNESVIIVDFNEFLNSDSIINNKRELGAFLANISKETTGGWQLPIGGGSSGDYASWGLYFVHELGYNSSNSKGVYSTPHTEYPPDTSQGYYGRGPIQLSWNYNYGAFSKFLFKDSSVLLKNPNLLQTDGKLAFKSAIWFWMMPQCPKPSCHQVMHNLWKANSGDYSDSKMFKSGFAHTNNIINGGLECRSSSTSVFTQKVALRADLYKFYLSKLGLSTAQILLENTGDKSTLCYESTSNAMTDYINCLANSFPECSITYRNFFITSCDSFRWNLLPSKLYTNSNSSDSVKIKNHCGCDSIIRLNLTIHNSNFRNDKYVVCNEFIWSENLKKYQNSKNTDTVKYKSNSGCDSIVALDLTINKSTSYVLKENIGFNDTFVFRNKKYFNSGVYRDTISNSKGCDSIIIIELSKASNMLENLLDETTFYFNKITNEISFNTGKFIDRIEIYDMTGKLIEQLEVNASSLNSILINVKMNQIYFLKISSDGVDFFKKFSTF